MPNPASYKYELTGQTNYYYITQRIYSPSTSCSGDNELGENTPIGGCLSDSAFFKRFVNTNLAPSAMPTVYPTRYPIIRPTWKPNSPSFEPTYEPTGGFIMSIINHLILFL